ncbi:probable serine/threonine-protein kinase PBL3 isoform X1 [Cucurbita maxima]|uniref:non-specific serine/threonine protein kinase n=1 Tax=Cucurbita maxima TaxID=3661 RepID=A0A6J1K7V7_CUCMA|nr:probable serine/threonine-protein kinase PBL3 isoform X1 [Cucurbita maxima]XP_022995418.1 probable serine/threonine-protein kinase PBL3 isoform X1 [Cucurbita maxima]
MGICCAKPAKLAHASSTNISARDNLNSKSNVGSTDSSQKTLSLTSSTSVIKPKFDVSGACALKSFSFIDLRNATKNFRSESLLGEGGFGCVFKGWIDEHTYLPTKPGTGIVVAVKKLKRGSLQGYKEWLAEVNYLGQLRHDNLVRLIGYCSESDDRLLVYEYMPKGSLENHLFRKGVAPISWRVRMNIAVDVARGLSFLHSCQPNVIYRDLKASNILLDSEFNAKLSDFGLAREGPTGDKTHVSTRVMGTRGYAAPEYVATGHLTPKSDVYSFGVVLLELLSGKRALDQEKVGRVEETLVDWGKPLLSDSKRMLRIMDTRMGGQYSRKEAQAAASLALNCLHTDPKNRPSMVDVLEELERLLSSKDVLRTPDSRAIRRTPPARSR